MAKIDIKLSRELVKERLETDTEFKEYYNKLDESEKEEIRRLLLSHKELKESIRESFTTEMYLRDQVQSLFEQEIKKRGQKSIYSKKAKWYATSKVFCYKIDDKHLVAVKFIPSKKSYSCEISKVTEVHSPKGKLYIKEGNFKTIYTGHFFDRYSERLNILGDRDNVVFSYLISNWDNQEGMVIDGQSNVTSTVSLGGLGLGALVVDVIFIKTYISEEQISSNQHQLRDNIYKHLNLVA